MAENQSDGQADYVEIATFDAANEFGAKSLNGIGSSFIHRFAAKDVGVDFRGGQFGEFNQRDFAINLKGSRFAQTDPGKNFMSAAGQELQHAAGVGCVIRFAEDLAVNDDGGVSRKDDVVNFKRDRESFRCG